MVDMALGSGASAEEEKGEAEKVRVSG